MVRFINDSRTAPTDQVPVQVIGAGLPRTATSSLQAALEQLGFNPCLHMAQVLPHPKRIQLLIDAAKEEDTARRQKLVHQLTDGYPAVTDMPAVFFLEDLMDLHPEAKVVLGVRSNPELWSQSIEESFRFFFSPRFFFVGLLWQTDRLWYQMNMYIIEWCQRKFGQMDVFQPAMYELYNQAVREAAKKRGREVLEFKAEDGWKPLCDYLGKDVPTAPFPRVNEKKTFTIIKTIFIAKGLASWMALGGATWFAWRYIGKTTFGC
ncbi:hypothetical protein N7456_009616 [Penicillium angulare]|uniref:NAD dependent epimerase/dehydratase n=1 Tax=Penicillium angulare TaxID=116970 RepID=A0A9W9F4Z6_9EURO|nr:hypothetical protein N7456_009616 [Penicillium angulare]